MNLIKSRFSERLNTLLIKSRKEIKPSFDLPLEQTILIINLFLLNLIMNDNLTSCVNVPIEKVNPILKIVVAEMQLKDGEKTMEEKPLWAWKSIIIFFIMLALLRRASF